MEKQEKEKSGKGRTEERRYRVWPVVKRLVREIRKGDGSQTGRVAVYTLCAGLYPFLAVLLPRLAIGILERDGSDAMKRLVPALGIYFLAAALLGYAARRTENMIKVRNMRRRLVYLVEMGDKLMGMDYCQVEDSSFWEKNEKALSAGNNNAEGIEGVSNKICLLPSVLVSLTGMTLLTAGLSPLILAALVVHAAVTMWISRQDHQYRYARREEDARFNRRIRYYYKTTHDFSFGKDIRIYNLRERVMANYQAEIDSLRALTARMARHQYLLGLTGILTLLLTDVLMYGILICQAVRGMPISQFTMYVALINTLMASMLTFGQDVTFIRNQCQYVGDFYRLVDERLEDGDKEKISVDGTLEIVFEHVDFRYPGSDTYIFKDLNFTIHKGERLAIVGVNGAGKSTLVKLMTGLFSPTAGHIYINGTDIEKFRKRDLYRLYSAVFQDVNILAFSILENVTGGSDPEAGRVECRESVETELAGRNSGTRENGGVALGGAGSETAQRERVRQVLEKVGLWQKVQETPGGLDQMMLKVIDENGTDFSGGQRQKLSIARGLYKDTPMVIMDEPTAALDALAEAEIYESFSDMVKGKTAVYISHRLASTKFCDKIALFDRDGLKEYGSHEELMALEGEYYRMFTVQGKYYQQVPGQL